MAFGSLEWLRPKEWPSSWTATRNKFVPERKPTRRGERAVKYVCIWRTMTQPKSDTRRWHTLGKAWPSDPRLFDVGAADIVGQIIPCGKGCPVYHRCLENSKVQHLNSSSEASPVLTTKKVSTRCQMSQPITIWPKPRFLLFSIPVKLCTKDHHWSSSHNRGFLHVLCFPPDCALSQGGTVSSSSLCPNSTPITQRCERNSATPERMFIRLTGRVSTPSYNYHKQFSFLKAQNRTK